MRAMSMIANNIQCGWLINVIHNPMLLQPNYDLENLL